MVWCTRLGLGDRDLGLVPDSNTDTVISDKLCNCSIRRNIPMMLVQINIRIAYPCILQHTRECPSMQTLFLRGFFQACKVKGLAVVEDDNFKHCLAWKSALHGFGILTHRNKY